jgi:hypothetical protein
MVFGSLCSIYVEICQEEYLCMYTWTTSAVFASETFIEIVYHSVQVFFFLKWIFIEMLGVQGKYLILTNGNIADRTSFPLMQQHQ